MDGPALVKAEFPADDKNNNIKANGVNDNNGQMDVDVAVVPSANAKENTTQPEPQLQPRSQQNNVKPSQSPKTKNNRLGDGGRRHNDGNHAPNGNSSPRKHQDARNNKPRVFIGNLSNDTTEEDIRSLFAKYTDAPLDIFFDKQKWFAFVKLDTKENAEKAKKGIDGATYKNRVVRVRHAPQTTTFVVKNLGPNVSNELLTRAFKGFGDMESAVVTVDERGRPCGEGVVVFNFGRKERIQKILQDVNKGVFLLGASPRPVAIELQEQRDSEDGLPEVHISYRPPYKNEVSEPPRFAAEGSLEYEFGMRWKKLYENHVAQVRHEENMFREACVSLESEMVKSADDFELNKMKQSIAQQQQELDRMMQKRNQRRGDQPNNGNQGQRSPQNQPQQSNLFMNQPALNMAVPIPPPGFGAAGLPGLGQLAAGMGGPFGGSGPQFPESGGFGPGNGMMGQPGMRLPFGGPGIFMPHAPNFGGQFDHQNPPRPRFDDGINRMGDRTIGGSQRFNQKRGGGGNGHQGGNKRPRNNN